MPAATCAGSLDPYFNSGTGVSRYDWSATLETVGAMVVATNQDVIVGGLFNFAQCRHRTGLARFYTDGYIDDSFNPVLTPAPSQIEPVVTALALQPDGRILVGGRFSAANGASCPGLVRLNYDGSTEPSFAPTQQWAKVMSLVLQPDLKVLVAAAMALDEYEQPRWPALVRLLTNGLPDPSFTFTNAYVELIRNLLLLPDGKILVNGNLRLNPDGTQDSTFTPLPLLEGYVVRASLLQPDGKVLLALSDQQPTYPDTGGGLIRLLPDGGYDPDFTNQLSYQIPDSDRFVPNFLALALQPDGRIYVGGTFGAIGEDSIALVARLWPNGEVDHSFQPSFSYSPGADLPEFVARLTLDANGKLLVGGWFTAVNGFGRQSIARLHTADDGCAGIVSLASRDFYVAENEPYANLTLQRSGNTNGSAAIAYWTFDFGGPNYAVAGQDYLARSGLVTFAPGQTEAQLQIPILDDKLVEHGWRGFEEFFGIALSMTPNCSNAAVSLADGNMAVIHIDDDDISAPGGVFSFTNTYFRVSEEAGSLTLDVVRYGPNSSPASVEYETIDGTAKAGRNYTAQSGVLEFAAGDAGPHTITIPTLHDNVASPSLDFQVRLRNPSAGTSLGTNYSPRVVITNTDAGVYMQVCYRSTNDESSAVVYGFIIDFFRCGPVNEPWQFQLVASNLTAVAGEDFTLTNSQISFLAGETQKTVRVYGIYNSAPEPDKSFELHLLPASAGAVVGEPSSVQLTILDINRPTRILTPPRLNAVTGQIEFTIDVSPALNFYVLGSDDLVHWDVVQGYSWQYGNTIGVVQDREGFLHPQRFYTIATFPH